MLRVKLVDRKERDRDTKRDRQTDRQRQREAETDRQRGRQTDRQSQGARNRISSTSLMPVRRYRSNCLINTAGEVVSGPG